MSSQHVVPLYIKLTFAYILEVLCFLEVDMNYLQTRLCKLKKSELTNRGSCLWILVDNTHMRNSFYTVYS